MGMAMFTDTETVTANVFTTGTLDLTAAPATAAISYADMAPGDMVTAPLTVTNSGGLDLRYSMAGAQTAGDPGLGAALSVAVRTGVAACTNAGFGLSGSALTSGTLAASSFGDASAGAQAGDRTLAPAASEVLCYQVSLPITAGNALQGLSATGSITLSAEQTRNNP
jgi:hypothetical protein